MTRLKDLRWTMFYLANGMEEAHPGVSQLLGQAAANVQTSTDVLESVRWHKLLELRNNFQNFIRRHGLFPCIDIFGNSAA